MPLTVHSYDFTDDLGLVRIVPLDGLTVLLTNPAIPANTLSVTFTEAEADSTVTFPEVRQSTAYGVSLTVCHRIVGTLFFAFNDFTNVDSLKADLEALVTWQVDSLDILYQDLSGNRTTVNLLNATDEVHRVAFGWEIEPHPERGMRLKITIDGLTMSEYLSFTNA